MISACWAGYASRSWFRARCAGLAAYESNEPPEQLVGRRPVVNPVDLPRFRARSAGRWVTASTNAPTPLPSLSWSACRCGACAIWCCALLRAAFLRDYLLTLWRHRVPTCSSSACRGRLVSCRCPRTMPTYMARRNAAPSRSRNPNPMAHRAYSA